MKFPIDPNAASNINPNTENGSGRIILILIVAALSYWIFNSWADWENSWNEAWEEISTEINLEFGSDR